MSSSSRFRLRRATVPAHVLVPALFAAGLIVVAVFIARPVAHQTPRAERLAAVASMPLPPGVVEHATPHYLIHSAADEVTTAEVAKAVEALHTAYAQLFPLGAHARMELVLYRDRAQFKAYNRSAPWAEAYYREPRCHAYAGDAPNRHHWMLHEATHQLLREGSGYHLARWANEGVAAYFGASRIVHGRLQAGTTSPDAYPIWWLAGTPLTGNRQRDVETGAFIPLATLLDSDGVDIGAQLNRYYVEWWSLTHFLLHGDGGRHARGFREALAHGANRGAFERWIGPVPLIEKAWYADLKRSVDAASTATAPSR